MTDKKKAEAYPKELKEIGEAYDQSFETIKMIHQKLMEHHQSEGVEMLPNQQKQLAEKIFLYGGIQKIMNQINKKK